MTAALEGGEWSAVRPGRTLPLGKTLYPLYRRLGGPQGRSGQTENLVATGIRSRTVQPIVSRYTDWATRPIDLPFAFCKIISQILFPLFNHLVAGGHYRPKCVGDHVFIRLLSLYCCAGAGMNIVKREIISDTCKGVNCVAVRNVSITGWLSNKALTRQREEYGELLTMPADGRWDLTRRLKG